MEGEEKISIKYLIEFFETRHKIIHKNEINYYKSENIITDIKLVETAIKKIYKKLIHYYNWKDLINA